MPELRPNANVPPEHLLNTLQSLEAAVDESTRGAQNKIYDQTAGSVASTRLVRRVVRVSAGSVAVPEPEETSWNLRVRGEMADDPAAKAKFSSFVRKACIRVGPDVHPDQPVIEWVPSDDEHTDGFHICRPWAGNSNPQVQVDIHFKNALQRYHVGELKDIVGQNTAGVQCIIEHLWQYVQSHKLRDKHSAKIKNDELLQRVFGVDTMDAHAIIEKLKEVLKPADDVVKLKINLGLASEEQVFSIDLAALPDCSEPVVDDRTAVHGRTLARLEKRIEQNQTAIAAGRSRIEFAHRLASAPSEFLQQTVLSHIHDQKIVHGRASGREPAAVEQYHRDWTEDACQAYVRAHRDKRQRHEG